MKYFLVASDAGTPLYFDHEDGTMVTLPMVAMQNVFDTNFNQPLYSLKCGNTIIVMKKVTFFPPSSFLQLSRKILL